MEENFLCLECSKSYSFRRNLRAHIIKCHPSKLEELAPTLRTARKFTCDDCEKVFSKQNLLRAHERTEHGKNDASELAEDSESYKCKQSNQKCPLCDFASTKAELLNHFKNFHDICISTEDLLFPSFQEFNVWKKDIETETKCSFVLGRGAQKRISDTHYFFVCHRSGVYTPRGNGIRHLKVQGSKKINGFCPASINVFETDGKCCVHYVKTHVGHKNEIGHMFLSKEDRMHLASKIAAGIPFERILSEIRDSISGDPTRMHLVTRHDLHNIEFRFNLSGIKHTDDAVSVEAWVNAMQHSENSCVLFYKPQEQQCNVHPELKPEDFVLIIMNEAQGYMLKKFGHDCICIDGTHGLNNYGFELITILVIDDLRQGFPCAFCICSRNDHIVMAVFFSYIQKACGNIKSNIFMSDMANNFYNGWCKVMPIPKKRLYCSWHVDRAWRGQLIKIKNKEKQVEAYKILRTLLEERDIMSFEKMLKAANEKLLSDNETSDFGQYFANYYTKNTQSWAYCYRMQCGLNTNMHLERMHKTIKYLYLNGKIVKRLDKSITIIMNFIRDKLVDRLIILHKGKLCTKLQNLRKRHTLALTKSYLVTENEKGWQVLSSDCSEIYIVEQKGNDCACQLTCADCNACIHKYTCTCIDASIKWNMCKHIHSVCQYRKSKEPDDHNDSEGNLFIDHDDDKLNEQDIISSELGKNLPSTSKTLTLVEKVQNMSEKFLFIARSIKNDAEYNAVNRLLDALQPTLDAVRAHNASFSEIQTAGPSNKNITPQSTTKKKNIEVSHRRLFSIKKGERKNTHKNLCKPTNEELQITALGLLNVGASTNNWDMRPSSQQNSLE